MRWWGHADQSTTKIDNERFSLQQSQTLPNSCVPASWKRPKDRRPNDEKIGMKLVEFLYLVFACMRDTYRKRLRSLLLCLCDVFRTLINSLVCWFCLSALGLVLVQIVMKKQTNRHCLWPTEFLLLFCFLKSEVETITIGQAIHTHICFAYLAFFEKQTNTSLIFICRKKHTTNSPLFANQLLDKAKIIWKPAVIIVSLCVDFVPV